MTNTTSSTTMASNARIITALPVQTDAHERQLRRRLRHSIRCASTTVKRTVPTTVHQFLSAALLTIYALNSDWPLRRGSGSRCTLPALSLALASVARHPLPALHCDNFLAVARRRLLFSRLRGSCRRSRATSCFCLLAAVPTWCLRPYCRGKPCTARRQLGQGKCACRGKPLLEWRLVGRQNYSSRLRRRRRQDARPRVVSRPLQRKRRPEPSNWDMASRLLRHLLHRQDRQSDRFVRAHHRKRTARRPVPPPIQRDDARLGPAISPPHRNHPQISRTGRMRGRRRAVETRRCSRLADRAPDPRIRGTR